MHLIILSIPTNNTREGGFSMRDLKTYLSVAPILSTLWFGAVAGLSIEINRFFPGSKDTSVHSPRLLKCLAIHLST